MALTDTFVKKVKYAGKSSGEKYADGGGMYLHVTTVGKYWRMAYRFMERQKTLSMDVYHPGLVPGFFLPRQRAT